MNHSPKVTVVIVNWNGKTDTLECLKSLEADGYSQLRIVVVDNGSSDGSLNAFASAYPRAEVLHSLDNLGFSGGNNLAIRKVFNESTDFFFLLNNDTTVEQGTIAALVNAAEQNSEAGILTPVIYYFDQPEERWFAGSRIELARGEAVHDNSDPPAYGEAPRSIPWASGCAMLIPFRVMKQVGGFDDRFFLNWEDVDLSLRVRERGFDILLVPQAKIHHKVSRSMQAISWASRYYQIRNNMLFISLHSKGHRFRATLHVITKSLKECGRAAWRREPEARACLMVTIRAFIDHLRKRYGALDGDPRRVFSYGDQDITRTSNREVFAPLNAD